MEHLLSNWYIYIYDNMYSLTGVYKQLTTYSDAINKAFSDGTLHTAYIIMMSLGLGMLVVYFVISLGTRLQGRETSPSVFFKTMLEFFVGYALAINSFDIVRTLFQLGDAMIEYLPHDSTGESLESYLTIFSKSLENLSFLDKVLYALKALVPYLACIITSFFLIYVLVTRVLRISVNAVMSPIAVANFFEGSRRSDSIRFLKRTAAMCIQCSVIMIIVVAVTDLSGYMASNSLYSSALSSTATVEQAKQDMIDKRDNNYSQLSSDVNYAVDKLGSTARNGILLKDEYRDAKNNLLLEYDNVSQSEEAEFKQYESLLGIEIFSRDGSSYEYDDNPDERHAILKDKYVTFQEDYTKNFMDTLLGNQNYIVIIMLLAVKVGMIRRSMSLGNTIVGL